MNTTSTDTRFSFGIYRDHIWVRDIEVLAGTASIALVKALRKLDDGEEPVSMASGSRGGSNNG